MRTPNYVLGTKLSLGDQHAALRVYTHRYTRDHKPVWARNPWKDGKPYPIQFDSDKDWLAHTEFPVGPNGKLLVGKGHACQSSPTWPDNPELAGKRSPGVTEASEPVAKRSLAARLVETGTLLEGPGDEYTAVLGIVDEVAPVIFSKLSTIDTTNHVGVIRTFLKELSAELLP